MRGGRIAPAAQPTKKHLQFLLLFLWILLSDCDRSCGCGCGCSSCSSCASLFFTHTHTPLPLELELDLPDVTQARTQTGTNPMQDGLCPELEFDLNLLALPGLVSLEQGIQGQFKFQTVQVSVV